MIVDIYDLSLFFCPSNFIDFSMEVGSFGWFSSWIEVLRLISFRYVGSFSLKLVPLENNCFWISVTDIFWAYSIFIERKNVWKW
jgi:hypothetical protein